MRSRWRRRGSPRLRASGRPSGSPASPRPGRGGEGRPSLLCLAGRRELLRTGLPLLLLTLLSPAAVLAMPLVEKRFVDEVILPQRLDLLPGTVGLYALLWLLAAASSAVGALLRTSLGEQATNRLRRRLLAHAEELALPFSQREHDGRTAALFLNDAPIVAALLSGTLFAGVGTLVVLAVGTAIMVSLSWPLALVAGAAPLLVAGAAALVTRPLRPATRRVQEKAAEVVEQLQENLAGLREVVAFGREQLQQQRFGGTLDQLVRLRMRLTLLDTALQTGQSVVSLVVSLAIYGYGGYLVVEGQATLGSVLAIGALFGQLFGPIGQLFGLVASLQRGLAAADRLDAFLRETPSVSQRPDARAPARVEGAIRFERVGFAYRPGQPVLRDVSFEVEPGQTVALVGPSGAGKSTLVGLIARFYDPDEGRITLDGADLRALALAGLRSRIGIVFQDTFLFAGSVRDNIAFGCEHADESAIVAAARAANAWEFIAQLPEGLDSQVGQRGVQLSEGQRQRLAIARALLRDPRILILDEPTSALDARSEHLVQSALETLMQGRTTFVVAHRLSTVKRADRILVVDRGLVVEQGRHDELIAGEGLYRQLVELQFGGEERSACPRSVAAGRHLAGFDVLTHAAPAAEDAGRDGRERR